MKKISKAAFQKMLNDRYGVGFMSHGNNKNRKAKNRPYGIYLRCQDREMFNVNYQNYLTTGEY